jgi:nitrate reductase gamma subunit
VTSSLLAYIAAGLGLLIFLGVVAAKCAHYLRRPPHLRWEIHPLPHAPAGAMPGAAQAGRRRFLGGVKETLKEALLLRSLLRHNRALWLRAYPFHLGLYLLGLAHLMALANAVLLLVLGPGGSSPEIFLLLERPGNAMVLAGFICAALGAGGLLVFRLRRADLRRFSSPEHFLHLGLFIAFSLMGLVLRVYAHSYFLLLSAFFYALLTFSFWPIAGLPFDIYIICMFALLAYIPATHMGHFFMKYFLWHDIRWDDRPVEGNPSLQRRLAGVLDYPVSWKAAHIGGDGRKTWREVAASNPARPSGPAHQTRMEDSA